jgi:hypothetical protein
MGKYYVKSGSECRKIVLAETPLRAAMKSVLTWKSEKRKMEASVHVSEVGFEGDHPHHENDVVIPTNFAKKKLRG